MVDFSTFEPPEEWKVGIIFTSRFESMCGRLFFPHLMRFPLAWFYPGSVEGRICVSHANLGSQNLVQKRVGEVGWMIFGPMTSLNFASFLS